MALRTPKVLRGSALAASAADPREDREARGPWAPPGRIVELCAGPDSAQTTAAAMVLREAQSEGDPVAWIAPRESGLYPPDLADAGIDLDALVVVHVPRDVREIARAGELVLRTGAFGAIVLDLEVLGRNAEPLAVDASRLAALTVGHGSPAHGLLPPCESGASLRADRHFRLAPRGVSRASSARFAPSEDGVSRRFEGTPSRSPPTACRLEAAEPPLDRIGSAAWQGRLLGLAREHACRVIVLSPNASVRPSLGPLVSLRFDVRRKRAGGAFLLEMRVIKDKLGTASGREVPAIAPDGAR